MICKHRNKNKSEISERKWDSEKQLQSRPPQEFVAWKLRRPTDHMEQSKLDFITTKLPVDYLGTFDHDMKTQKQHLNP